METTIRSTKNSSAYWPFNVPNLQNALRDRLRTRSIPAFMQQFLYSRLSGRPEYWLRFYDRRRLGFVRHWVEPFAQSQGSGQQHLFSCLCQELANATGPQAVAARIGTEFIEDYPFFPWEEWAEHATSTGDHLAVLYCLTNAWVQLDFRCDLTGHGGWRGTWSAWEVQAYRVDVEVSEPHAMASEEATRILKITSSLQALNLHRIAGEAFGYWLGIEDQEVYDHPRRLLPILNESVLGQLHGSPLSTALLQKLVSVLEATGRKIETGFIERFGRD